MNYVKMAASFSPGGFAADPVEYRHCTRCALRRRVTFPPYSNRNTISVSGSAGVCFFRWNTFSVKNCRDEVFGRLWSRQGFLLCLGAPMSLISGGGLAEVHKTNVSADT